MEVCPASSWTRRRPSRTPSTGRTTAELEVPKSMAQKSADAACCALAIVGTGKRAADYSSAMETADALAMMRRLLAERHRRRGSQHHPDCRRDPVCRCLAAHLCRQVV